MKKSEIARQFDLSSANTFAAAYVAFTSSSFLTFLTSVLANMNSIARAVFQIITIIFMIFAYVMTVKGFSLVNKACRLSETNEYFYLGRNLKIASIACVILSVLAEIAAFAFYIILYGYTEYNNSFADPTAANNIKIITAVVVIIAQLVSISVPYAFYLFKIHKITPKSDRINSVALLGVMLIAVQITIGILNAVYSVNGGSTVFLSRFTEILKILSDVVLLVFFFMRKSRLSVSDEVKIEN